MISNRIGSKIINQYRTSELLTIETTIKRYGACKKTDNIFIILNEKLSSADNEGFVLFTNHPEFDKICDRIGGINKITYRKWAEVIDEGWIFNKITVVFEVIDIL